MTAREIVTSWAAGFMADPARAAKLAARVKFVVSGQGGGTWVLDCRGAPMLLEEDSEADCTLAVSADNLIQMSRGTLNPQAAFLDGRLGVRGDYSVALKLSTLLFSDSNG